LDAIIAKVCTDAHVVNKPVYIALRIDLDGAKHLLGLWIGKAVTRGLRPIYTTPTIAATVEALNTFETEWETSGVFEWPVFSVVSEVVVKGLM